MGFTRFVNDVILCCENDYQKGRILTTRFIYHDIINCLVGALDAKDVYTAGHSERVGDMAHDLAEIYGLEEREMDSVHIAGHLHDIGKIGISDKILLKESALTDEEFEEIKKHPEIGSKILLNSTLLNEVSSIVLHHHERYDGRGYPNGLAGEDIPLGSRIIAICDSIDAMMSNRIYRPAFSWDYCKKEILSNAGKMYDPVLVAAINEELWFKWANYYIKLNKKIDNTSFILKDDQII